MDSYDGTPQHIRTIITKFLQKETSDEELALLKEWLEEDEKNILQFEEINDTFQSLVTITKLNAGTSDRAWKTLRERIEVEKGTKVLPFQPRYSFLIKIAASVALVLSSYFILKSVLGNKENALHKPILVQNSKGNKTSLVLPDSSIVFLNANSTLEYSDDFGENSREVRLNGEAFFDVRKGRHEFVVTTSNLSIQVKGTKFNVSSTDLDGTEKTTLEEGHVVLQIKGKEKVYDMKPGDQIMFNAQSKKVTLKKVNPTHYSAWKEDHLHFENMLLYDIVIKLENRYKVNITIDEELARREWLTMTIENESIEEVLELIKLSSRLQYRIKDNQITIYE
jgi:transmembrane sensor